MMTAKYSQRYFKAAQGTLVTFEGQDGTTLFALTTAIAPIVRVPLEYAPEDLCSWFADRLFDQGLFIRSVTVSPNPMVEVTFTPKWD